MGYYIYYNGSTLLDYPAMYAGVIAMSLLGLGMYFSVDWLERKWCKWKFLCVADFQPRNRVHVRHGRMRASR